MKHIVIGDLHGKDVWREINIKNYDKVVFLGDYVDSFTLPDLAIDQNLQDIIQLKKDFPDKIVLLLGNHDMQYMFYPYLRCSGFRDTMKRPLKALFNMNENLFQIAYQHRNYLFTHAGLTNAWYLEFMQIPRWRIKDSPQTLAYMLNAANNSRNCSLLYRCGVRRGGERSGGIIWADKSETETDMLVGYHQVVGHTPIDEVYSLSYDDTSVTYIDVLDTVTYFYEIDC